MPAISRLPAPSAAIATGGDLGLARDRVGALAGVAALHGLLGYALITGLGFDIVRQAGERLKIFDIPAPPPPVPVPPPPATVEAPAEDAPEAAASPPNLKAIPTEIVAPPPAIVLEPPPTIVAAPVAALGDASSAGAAPVPGPGFGAGVVGAGFGSGRGGNGSGGGGDGIAVRARQTKGAIRNRDYPDRAYDNGKEGRVVVSFWAETNGRAGRCRVVQSSGDADLDGATCYLILRRYRYEPARDIAGRKVPQEFVWIQEWWLPRPGEAEAEARERLDSPR